MQPINARMVLHHIAETGCLPPLSDIAVIHTANVTVDEDTRSRYKWMAHLPLFTPVTIVDVELSPVVGEATMQAFKQELPLPSPQALSASSSSSPSLSHR